MVQGALVAYAGIPSFVVTLGGLLFFRNAAYQLNEGKTVAPLDETFQLLGGGLNGTIGAFWSWVVGVAAIAAIACRRSRSRRPAPALRLRGAHAAGRGGRWSASGRCSCSASSR